MFLLYFFLREINVSSRLQDMMPRGVRVCLVQAQVYVTRTWLAQDTIHYTRTLLLDLAETWLKYFSYIIISELKTIWYFQDMITILVTLLFDSGEFLPLFEL